ncbi:MAG: hypothetical protein Athens071425_514 [Parcubacteria group bacterium Athens0714_25]|nr:MAG: hypothetical protein Athens071425_514 [Parcubacteria group bacterium Athens0714_25]
MSEVPKINAVIEIKSENSEIFQKVENEKEKIEKINEVLEIASQEADILEFSEDIKFEEVANKKRKIIKRFTALCVGMSIFAGTFAGMPESAEAGGRHSQVSFSDVAELAAGVAAVNIITGVSRGIGEGAYRGMGQATEKVILNSAGIETDQQRYDRYRYEALERQRAAYPPQYGYVRYQQAPQGYYPQPPAYHHITGENPRVSQPVVERGHDSNSNKIEYHKALVQAGEKLYSEKDKIFDRYVDSSGKSGEMSKEKYDELIKSAEEKYKSQVEKLKEAYLGQQGNQRELSDEKVPEQQLEQQDDDDDGIKTEELREDSEREKYSPPNRDDL